MFPVAPTPRGPAAPVPPPPVGAPQNNTQPSSSTGAKPWTSESALTQESISGADAEAESPPANLDEEFDMASDGTTGETEALTTDLSDFSLHSDMAANRTTSLPDIEKKRINGAQRASTLSQPISGSSDSICQVMGVGSSP